MGSAQRSLRPLRLKLGGERKNPSPLLAGKLRWAFFKKGSYALFKILTLA
jgi:hypothetical protein